MCLRRKDERWTDGRIGVEWKGMRVVTLSGFFHSRLRLSGAHAFLQHAAMCANPVRSHTARLQIFGLAALYKSQQ